MKPLELIADESSEESNARYYKLKGYLDAHTVLHFDAEIENILKVDAKNLVFDLSELQYISSSGIGSLMGLTQKLNAEGGDLILTNLSHKVDNIFDLLGFNKIFKIAASRKEAAEMLQQGNASDSQ